MRYKRRKVYFKLYLSYIIILILPIVIGFIIYFQALQTSREQTDFLNRSLMQMIKKECDSRIGEVKRNLNRLALDRRVQILSNVKGSFLPKNQYTLYTLFDDLQNNKFLGLYYEDVFVYFSKTDSVVSVAGNMSLELFYHLYYEDESFTLQDMREYLTSFHYQDILPLYKKDASDGLLFTITSLGTDIGDTSAVIGIRLNKKMFEERIEDSKWDDDIEVMIINSRNEVINGEGKRILEEQFYYENLVEGTDFICTIQEKEYTGLVMESEECNWKYVLLMPRHLVEAYAGRIQRVSILGLFVCVLIGFAGSYYMTKINYNPLKSLMNLFKGHNREELAEVENEYQWMEKQAQLFFKEHMDTKQMLDRNSKLLKQYYLFRLLEQPYEEICNDMDREKYLNRLTAPYNVVLLFHMEEWKSREEEEQIRENDLYRFIISNIVEEVLSEHFNVEMAEAGRTAAIVNLPDNSDILMEVIKESILSVHKLLEEKLHLNIVTLIGEVHMGLEGIHASYREAKEAEEYVPLLDTTVIFYHEIKNLCKRYYYPIEEENKILNALKAGNPDAVCDHINRVLDVNYTVNQISVQMCRYLLYDMMGTLLKGADESGLSAVFEQEGTLVQISVKQPLSEVKEIFRETTNKICENIVGLQGKEDNEMSEKIKSYIMDNFMDPDLNISQTGFYFNVTPAYLSSVFKKQTGKSLLKYINHVRVEEAIVLLGQGESVVETAVKVGFRDSRTFIRVFKEHMGVTPGQMKKH